MKLFFYHKMIPKKNDGSEKLFNSLCLYNRKSHNV